MKKTLIALAGLLLLLCAAARAQEQPADVTGKVNLIMDDGTIIMYVGAKQGVRAGDEFAAYRQDKQVGSVKIFRVTDVAAYGKPLSGDIKEMDTLVRNKVAAPAPPPKAEQPIKSSPVKSTPAKTEEPKPAPPKTEPKKAETPKTAEKPASSEKSQKKAEAEKKAEPRPEAKKEEKPRTEDKSAERKPVPPPENIPPKMPKDKGPARTATYYGTTGLLFMPTADVFPQGSGAVHLHMLNATDKSLQYKDTGFGVTYGVSQDIEVAYQRVNTKSTGGTGYSNNTNMISIKYLAMKSNPGKAPAKTNEVLQSELNYAAGLTYYTMGSVNIPGVGMTKAKVTRIYLVGSGEYASAKVHVGVYDQTGTLLRLNGNYKGFGFLLGAEYPLGGMLGAPGGLSLIGEYDPKAYYLDTMRTPSIGLRYKADAFSVTLGILDVTQAKIFSLGGEYNF